MPANLTPAYKAAEAQFRGAVTREEKIAALEEMLRIIPKHKGTDKLQADLRSRLSKLRREPTKKGPTRGQSHRIPHEGAGQVALVGPPNAGKSSLVAALTHAKPDIAPYPMTTRDAVPGMMPYEDVVFQLVDLPPLCDEYVAPWVFDLIRAAHLAWLVVSIERPLVGLDIVRELLRQKAIELVPAGAHPAEAPRPGWMHKPTLLVVTGMDRDGAAGDLDVLEELLDTPWPIVPVSAVAGTHLEDLGTRTYAALDIIRVYTKQPKEEPDHERPFTLPRGSTVHDLARTIHQDIAEGLKFARVWGPSAFDGQSVHEAHVLEEGDVVEIHW
jgi:ribosome-interacting GTPase 1